MSIDPRSPEELYDASAERWVRSGPLSLSDFTGRPPVLALCEPLEGACVLDLGCGEGYCSRELRRRGASKVVGVDISAAMVDAARAQEAKLAMGIEYGVGDATDLARFEAETFDLVLAMFVFNYLNEADTERSFQQVARVLKPKGRFVFAVPHPALPWLRGGERPFYFAPGSSGYFSAKNQRLPGKIWKRDGSFLEVQAQHKTFESYFEALSKAGFRGMPKVRELGVTPEILAVDPEFFGPLLDVPLHLAFAVTQ